jgi:acetyltransferase-like isoleucine patch superfamily enzyme
MSMRNDGTHIDSRVETTGNHLHLIYLKLRAKCYTWWNKRKFAKVGHGFLAPGPIHVINGKCISLGHDVFLGEHCQLYAYSNGEINIGDGTSIDRFVELRGGKLMDIKDRVRIVKYATLKAPEQATMVIGSRTIISQGCILDGGIKVGNDVTFGPYVFVSDEDHGFQNSDLPMNLQEGIIGATLIEDDVWIANGVSILKNVIVSKGSIIGAGAVVNRSLPAFSINVGIPAKTIKYRSGHDHEVDEHV